MALSAATVAAAAANFGKPPSAFSSTDGSDVILGAIRWDAWYRKSDASAFAQRSLSSPKYYQRAPFYCSVAPQYEVNCTGSLDEMDAEIRAASDAGLNYWAFDWYEADSSLRTGWSLYQRSSFRHLLKWCGIVGLANLGSLPFGNNLWQGHIREWADYMRQPEYQKIQFGGANRPLLYILWDGSQLKYYFDDQMANVRVCFNLLRKLLAEHGIGAPYIVLLAGIPGCTLARQVGGDAIGNYIPEFAREEIGSYADLDRQTRNYWARMAATGYPTVPIAMVGWDTRPRQERPVPWESNAANPNPTEFYVPPTPVEFEKHMDAAFDFIHDHPLACPSKVLLLYSWNECDEGGGIIPTIGDRHGKYLSAIAAVTRRFQRRGST